MNSTPRADTTHLPGLRWADDLPEFPDGDDMPIAFGSSRVVSAAQLFGALSVALVCAVLLVNQLF